MNLKYTGRIEVKVYDKTLGCNCRQTVYIIPKHDVAGLPISVRVWRACDPSHSHNFNRIPQTDFIR